MAEIVARTQFCLLLTLACLFDLRERRCPNVLSAALSVISVLLCLFCSGFAVLGWHALMASFTCLALIAFELMWRRVYGASGLGMGDIKVLFSLCLVDPARGVLSFCLGLIFLALFGVFMRQRTLPALPFLCGAFFLLTLLALL